MGKIVWTAGIALTMLTANAANEVNATAGIAVDARSKSEGVIVIDEQAEKGPEKIVNAVNGCPVGSLGYCGWYTIENPVGDDYLKDIVRQRDYVLNCIRGGR